MINLGGSAVVDERTSFTSFATGTLLSTASVQTWITRYSHGLCTPQPWHDRAACHFMAECLYEAGVHINVGPGVSNDSGLLFNVYGGPVRELNREVLQQRPS